MKKSVNNRIFELDFLRGLALFLMCLDHFTFDLACLPGLFPFSDSPVIAALGEFGESVFFSPWRMVLHYIFATLFLLMAGVGSSLTRNHGKRVLQISLGALAISGATVLLDLFFHLDATILFGVLSSMALGALVCWLCSLFGEKAGKYVALAVGLAVIAVGFLLPWYEADYVFSLGFEEAWKVAVGIYRYGADWFPIFPSVGVVAVGYFLGKILYRDRRSLIPALRGKTDYFFCFIGRKPLWIYLLHQPVLMGLLYLFVFLFVQD